MKNEISNEEMMKALSNDEYQKIMTKASKRFLGILSWDELDSCKKVALWKALANYDSEKTNAKGKKNKFTSYLFRGVFLECKTAVKFVMTMRDMENMVDENIVAKNNDTNLMETLDEVLAIKYGEVLQGLYIEGRTTKELATKYGVSPQTIQVRKKKALKSLEERLE